MDNIKIYEDFNWEELHAEKLKPKIEKILKLIPSDVKTIIDVGCGNGVITNVLAKKFDITGVDRSEKALSYVETSKIRASCDSIPAKSGNYDMAFSSELLEHLEDDVLKGTVAEMKRLSKKYILITVPNDENPNKLAIKCPECGLIFNRPNHLRNLNLEKCKSLFPEYKVVESFTFGNRVRYYQPAILSSKLKLSPSSSWIPYYWISKDKRKTICPRCVHPFTYKYRFNLIAFTHDIINVIVSPKKPYWLFVLFEAQKS